METNKIVYQLWDDINVMFPLLNGNAPRRWVYTKVWVQKNHASEQPLMDLTFGLKTRPNLKDRFLKLGVVLTWVEIAEIWKKNDATLAPLHFSKPLHPNPTSANSLNPKIRLQQ